MNKKLIAILIVAAMAASMPGCGCQRSINDESQLETTEVASTETTIPESLPGTVYNPEGGVEILEDEEVPESTGKSEQDTSGNTTDSDSNTKTEEKEDSNESTTPTSAGSKESESATQPIEETTIPTTGGSSALTEYEKYMAMSGAEQKAFMESFDSIEAFFAWLNAAKAEYETAHPDIEVQDGNVDLAG